MVCEPEPDKVQMLKPYLKRLADQNIPHFLFVNKIDKATGSLRDMLAYAAGCQRHAALAAPDSDLGERGNVTGFVDLALERAFVYRPHAPSEDDRHDGDVQEREKEARFPMLEKLADYDEHLMEELLSDVEPPRDEVFADLAKELSVGDLVPVLIGSAESDNGIRRLLKALRHEVPEVATTAARLGLEPDGDTVVQILKTYHSAHGGKLSLARVLNGYAQGRRGAAYARDGCDARVGGIFALKGAAQTKLAEAEAGDTVALGRLEGVVTGDTLSSGKDAKLPRIEVEQLRAGLPPRHRGRRPQGRGQAHRRHRQAARGRPLAASSSRMPSCTKWRWRARAKSISRSRSTSCRTNTASSSSPIRRACPTRRPSASPRPSAAATSASRAATASSATWCSRSGRCRAARASSSRTRSPAASCRGNGFRRSKRAWSNI